MYKITGLPIAFSDIHLPRSDFVPVYDPRIWERAVDKYIGNEKKIVQFKEILERISGVPVVQPIEIIEKLGESFLVNYPSSSRPEDLLQALDYANMTLIETRAKLNNILDSRSWQVAKTLHKMERVVSRFLPKS